MPSPESSTGADDAEHDADGKLPPIPDGDEGVEGTEQRETAGPSYTSSSSSYLAKSSTRHSSESPSYEGSKGSPTPSTTSSSAAPGQFSVCDPAFQPASARADWSHLPADYQYYLNSFCKHITHFHYSFATFPDNFLEVILPNMAVRHEPLLNAVVGFAAYRETLQNPDGQVEDFLKYYNRSVVLLLNTLQRREPPTIATLLTVLQLATMEVRHCSAPGFLPFSPHPPSFCFVPSSSL
jgi:hypothetical protein